MSDKMVVFEGIIRIADRGDSSDALWLGDEVLAKEFADALGERRRQVSVRYWISMKSLTERERIHASVMMAVGEGYAEFIERCSSTTGYLWTDEGLRVGGHNLDGELRCHAGSWCRLELTIHT